MIRILVTGIGGDIGQSIAQCVRNSEEEVILIGTDIHNKHGGYYFVDEYYTIPPATDSNYINKLKNLEKKHNIDVIIPTNENEIKVIANLDHGLKVIHCGKRIANIGLDKLATMESLKKLGINVPWTVNVANEMPSGYPCIIKPRFSSGSKSVFTVNSIDEAKFYSNKYPEAVFQELLEPTEGEITCGLYRTKDGHIAAIQLERILVGGLTGWAKVVKYKSVDNYLNKIATGLELQGSINVQLIITTKGPMIFEINPRFSSTAYMRHKLGFTDVKWSIKEYFGELIELTSAKVGTILVRNQDVRIL